MDALREVARIGPFFAVATDLAEPGWQPFTTLSDAASLQGRVSTAQAFLAGRLQVAPADVDERAVASMQFLGMAARLISPTLATAVCHGELPGLESLRWRPGEGGRVEYAIPAAVTQPADAAGYEERVLRAVIAPLEDAVRAQFRLSAQVTRGNVASALAGAAKVLGTARPEAASGARSLTGELLARPYLARTGAWPAGKGFRRTNCCLFYRLPAAGKCADCVLLATNRD